MEQEGELPQTDHASAFLSQKYLAMANPVEIILSSSLITMQKMGWCFWHVCTCRRFQKYNGCWVLPLRMTPQTHSSHMYCTKFCHSRSNGTSTITEIRCKNVTLINKDRSATDDFLLLIHSNHWPNLYHLLNKRKFWSKITNFSHTHVFNATPPTKGVPFGIL